MIAASKDCCHDKIGVKEKYIFLKVMKNSYPRFVVGISVCLSKIIKHMLNISCTAGVG